MKPYIVLCVFLMFQVCEANEPYCRQYSQYEYDEKMLSKMIRTEFALETLTKGMESLQSDIDTKLQTIMDEIETVRTKPAIQPQPSSESLTKGLESLQSDMDTKFQTIRDELETVRTKPAVQPQPSSAGPIGFTVTSPDQTKSGDKIVIFVNVITNMGDGFNKDTGKFRCKHSGLYYFSLVILRNKGSTSEARCHIMVNDKSKSVFAYAHSNDRGTYPSGSANLLVQLVEGDEVHVGDCVNIDKFYSVTHFSGFLVN